MSTTITPTAGCLGWTRYDGTSLPQEYDFRGFLAEENDRLGRCIRARSVTYSQEPAAGPGPNMNRLRPVPGARVMRIEYDGETDFRGKVVGEE